MADKPLQAGDLDRLATLLEKSEHLNGLGESLGFSDSPVAKFYVRKRELTGAEKQEAKRETASATVQFDARFRTDVEETMGLLVDGVQYDITAVQEGAGRRQWLVISARKHD